RIHLDLESCRGHREMFLEPVEQGRETCCGGWRGKGIGEREHRSVAHAPDTEWETHVPEVGRCAEGSKGKKVRAVHRSTISTLIFSATASTRFSVRLRPEWTA